jgi:hypothetical protein
VVTDSDGDGIPDGADDQDNDGWSNLVEMQFGRRQTGYRVHPFNPCLPDPNSPTCSRYLPIDGIAWPPFDKVGDNIYSAMPGDAQPLAWPDINYAAWVSAGRPLSLPSSGWVPTVFGPWNPTPYFFTKAWDGTFGPQGS